MIRIYLLLTALLSTLAMQAQEMGRIQGRVADPTGNPVAFATVIAYANSDSAVAKTGFTTEQGKYILAPLAAGEYFIQVQFAGLATYESERISLTAGQILTLEDIQMREPEADLDAVQITANKAMVEVQPDKTVFNVAGTANAIGENAYELLRKAPGVIVDNNDNIILMGKSGVRIYIDGKPSPLSVADLASMLKGMQSDQIESIEIITNPSARFDAEGNAGIINIKLKKDQSLGTNGSVSLGYAIGRFSKYTGSVNFNNRSKRVNVFGNYSGFVGRNYSFTDFYRIQSGTNYDQHTDRFDDALNNNIKFGADFFLSKKSTLGVMVNGFISDNETDNQSITAITDNPTGEALSSLVGINENIRNNQNFNFNLNYGYKGDDGSTWNLDADYGQFRFNNESFQPNYFISPAGNDTLDRNIFRIIAPTDIDIYTFKADHERNLAGGKLSAGIKIAFIETDNNFNFFDQVDGMDTLNLNRSNQFVYEENINAAYATYSRKIEKWNLQLGLRAEQTRTLGTLFSTQNTGLDSVDRQYLNLFPTAGITYSPSQKHSYRINYSRRIDRPRYQDLNPFINQLDQLTFNRGNPFLRPQFTDNLQFTYTYQYRYSASVSYSLTDDFFTQITDTLNGQASFLTQENLSTRQVISANISAPLPITKWWSSYTNLSVNNTQNRGDFNQAGETGKEININRTTFNVYQQHTFTLPKGISLELSGFYNSPSIWGANYLTREFWAVNAGAQMRLFDNRAVVKVSVSDLFYSMQWQGTQEFGGLYFDASGGWESRQFRVNLTYNFGNQKVKASRRRKTGLQDESSRAGSGGSGPGN
ncbi:MAG: TonB-dependent receptor [Bacteroidota bacterium]